MKKSEIYGIAATVLAYVLLFILLWLVMLPSPDKPEEEGVMISFGNEAEGGGMNEVPYVEPVQAASPPVTPSKPVKQELMTQQDNSVAIAEQQKKERERQERLEQERVKKENERRIAEQRRKEQEAIDNAKALDGMFGGSNTTGSGSTTGNTTQGNPAGSGTSGGNSWSLSGRGLMGSLVTPRYDNNVEGRITVNIRVDESGKVTNATIGSPTTISDNVTRNAALTAAQNTRFTSGNGIVTGTITYNFKLR